MGPWSTGKKNSSTTEDVMVHRQGTGPQRPRNGPERPSRVPGEGVDRGPRQVASPRGWSEGQQPEGRAVARSHGRPGLGPGRPAPPLAGTAARGPEASTSHHHATHVTPRQQTGAMTPLTTPSAASVRYPTVLHNERIRTHSNSSDPRIPGTMRNKRDTSPVKNVHNVRPSQGQSRSMGRGPQPGLVSARGGVPRPARPPAPAQPQGQAGKRPGQGPPNQEHSRGPGHQQVTSPSGDRNTSLPITGDAIRSGQQMVIVPTARHKGQSRPSQNQNAQNQNDAASSSKAQNPSRNDNSANTNQSHLPNNPGLRTDATRPVRHGPSRQMVQKAGNDNKTSRNINSDVHHHSGQRTNTSSDVIPAPDTNRHSSSSSSGGDNSNARNTSSSSATRHKQKNKTSKRESVKPDNPSENMRTSNANPVHGANTDTTREGTREASGSSSGQRHTPRSTVSPRDNPALNPDNPGVKQVQRPKDSDKNNSRLAADSQVLRPRQTPHVGASADQQRQGQGQRLPGDQSGRSDRVESADRNTGATSITENPRNRSQTTSHTMRQSESVTTPNMGSNQGQSDNSPTEGRGEEAGGGGQSGVSGTTGVQAAGVDNTQSRGRKPNKDRSTSRETPDRTGQQQRSSGQRSGLNEGSGNRNPRTTATTPAGSGDPGSSNTARNSRATNRSQSQPTNSANAPSNSAPTSNNSQDSANNVVSPQRRTEGSNAIRNNNTPSSNNRTQGQNRTAMAANNSSSRPSNSQNSSSRATAVQNISSGNSSSTNRPSGQSRANNSANSGARAPNQSRSNRSTNAASEGSSGTSQPRSAQNGAILDPSQLNIDIMDNSVSENPPPYSTLDVHTSGNRQNRNSRQVNRNSLPSQALPDILNSHVHQPRQNESRTNRPGVRRSQTQSTHQLPRGTTRLDSTSSSFEGCSKWGCLRCLTIITTFRWILITLALLGVACVLTGIVLGALHMTIGSSFLTLSLMFIGLGVMLVIVVGVGWKCTPRGHEPCHLLFNLGDHSASWSDFHAQPSSRARNNPRNQWVGGTIYDEFQYRRPPPSYNASMQEYQQQLVLAQIRQSTGQSPGQGGGGGTPSSPPPTYKSHASTVRPGLHITFPIPQGDDYPSSRPPTYRSTAGTLNRPRINTNPAQGENENERSEGTNNRNTESNSNQEQIMNEINNSQSRPDTPASSSTTLQRATNQVVNYLDDVLDNSIREMERENPSADVQSGNCTVVQITNASGADSETENRDSANSENCATDPRRISTTTTATTSSSSSDSSNSSSTSGATSNATGSNRNSSGSQTSRDSSHIIADTHL